MLRVVLVEPHYGGNIGSVARLIKNFEADELYLVSPRVSPLSDEALKWAVHAKDVLERAKVVNSLSSAISDCAVSVATTAKPDFKTVRRTVISPKELAEKISPYVRSKEKVALVFGREPSGLTNEEIELTDITVTIPTSPKYPAMNLSHSVAVILYEIYAYGHGEISPPSVADLSLLEQFFEKFVEISERKDPEEVMKAFRAVVRRGAKTEKEVGALIGVFAEVVRRCSKR